MSYADGLILSFAIITAGGMGLTAFILWLKVRDENNEGGGNRTG